MVQSSAAERRVPLFEEPVPERTPEKTAGETAAAPAVRTEPSALLNPKPAGYEIKIATLAVDEKSAFTYGAQKQWHAPAAKPEALLPCIVRDTISHLFPYALIVFICSLAVFNVCQVQQTRTMTATLNELSTRNESLSNEWLALLAQRQALSAHSLIARQAVTKLGMMQPKTADEIVLRLDR